MHDIYTLKYYLWCFMLPLLRLSLFQKLYSSVVSMKGDEDVPWVLRQSNTFICKKSFSFQAPDIYFAFDIFTASAVKKTLFAVESLKKHGSSFYVRCCLLFLYFNPKAKLHTETLNILNLFYLSFDFFVSDDFHFNMASFSCLLSKSLQVANMNMRQKYWNLKKKTHLW